MANKDIERTREALRKQIEERHRQPSEEDKFFLREAKVKEAFHRKKMEYFQEKIRIFEGRR